MIAAGLFAINLLPGCAAHRASIAAWEAEHTAKIDAAAARYRRCVLDFVRTHDTLRLTGYELADASDSACEPLLSAVDAAMVDFEMERRERRLRTAALRAQVRAEALAALATLHPTS